MGRRVRLVKNYAPLDVGFDVPGNSEVELETAGDGKVCPICDALEGQVFDTDSADTPYPPVHPNCRCTLIDADTGDVIISAENMLSSLLFLPRKAHDNPNRAPDGTFASDGGDQTGTGGGDVGGIGVKATASGVAKSVGVSSEKISSKTEEFTTSGRSMRDVGKQIEDGARNYDTRYVSKTLSDDEYDTMSKALRNRDYETSDRMYHDALKRDPDRMGEYKEHATEVAAFNNVMKERFEATDTVYRFVDMNELDSIAKSGEIKSGGGTGYTSFTLEKQSDHFGDRDAVLEVRKGVVEGLKPVEYVPLPRSRMLSGDVGVDVSQKTALFAAETELRTSGSVKLSGQSDMTIRIQRPVTATEAADIRNRYGGVGSVQFDKIL